VCLFSVFLPTPNSHMLVEFLSQLCVQVGFPPKNYKNVYTAAGRLGLNKVAHAGVCIFFWGPGAGSGFRAVTFNR
jgi:hypothetical protein